MPPALARSPRILRPDVTDEAFPDGFGAVVEPADLLRAEADLDALAQSTLSRHLRARHGAVVVPRRLLAEGLLEGLIGANQAPRSREDLARRFGAGHLAHIESLEARGLNDEAQALRRQRVSLGRLRWTGLGNASPNQTWLHSHPGLGAIEFLYSPSAVGLVACARDHLKEAVGAPTEPRCDCEPEELAYARECAVFYADHIGQGGFGDYVAAFDRVGRAVMGSADPDAIQALARHAVCINRALQQQLGLRCLHIDAVEFGYVAIDERLLHARDVRCVAARSEPACYRQALIPDETAPT